MTLSELTQLSDGVILFENTRIHELCSKLLKIERPSFKDLNFAIASQLGSTLFPSKTSRGGLCGIPEHCPHPGYRLLTVRSIPQVPERSKAFTVRGDFERFVSVYGVVTIDLRRSLQAVC